HAPVLVQDHPRRVRGADRPEGNLPGSLRGALPLGGGRPSPGAEPRRRQGAPATVLRSGRREAPSGDAQAARTRGRSSGTEEKTASRGPAGGQVRRLLLATVCCLLLGCSRDATITGGADGSPEWERKLRGVVPLG